MERFDVLTQTVRPFLYRVGPPFGSFGKLECYHGTITFNVALSNVHYETPIVLLLGILFELGALGVILHPIVTAVIQTRESSKSSMG